MKTMKTFGLLLVGLFLISLVSASDYYTVNHRTYEDGRLVEKITYNVDKDFWENEDRAPVYDYRHGYTYRTSHEYLKDRIEGDWRRDRKERRTNGWDGGWRVWGDLYYFDDEKTTEYNYVPYLDMYEARDCYDSAPKGKLFYSKCH